MLSLMNGCEIARSKKLQAENMECGEGVQWCEGKNAEGKITKPEMTDIKTGDCSQNKFI